MPPATDAPALFVPAGEGRCLPTEAARGPWSPDALHGGPVAALLAGALEQVLDAERTGLLPARLTVELLRPVPVTPLTVVARPTRTGRKVQLADAGLLDDDGTLLATARLLRIRTDDVPAPVTTDVAPPPPPADGTDTRPDFGADDWPAFHNVGTDHRFVAGRFGVPGPATDWIRLRVPVTPGVEPSPLQRVAAAADFGNGISGVATFETLLFINPDLTIHLHRLPVGEWVCLDAVTWMEGHGTALAESRLWDERGPLGRSLQSLLVDRRTP